MPSFNTIKGLEAFKAFGRFMSTSGGTEEVESEMQCLIKKNSLIIIIMTTNRRLVSSVGRAPVC